MLYRYTKQTKKRNHDKYYLYQKEVGNYQNSNNV